VRRKKFARVTQSERVGAMRYTRHMRATTSTIAQLVHSLAPAAACAALLVGLVMTTGCQSGPDDGMEDGSVDVEVDVVGDADADDVDQDPNIGEPMN